MGDIVESNSCIRDKNVFIFPNEDIKKKDIFVRIWDLIEKLLLENKIVIIKDVVDELGKIHDFVYDNVKTNRKNFFKLEYYA